MKKIDVFVSIGEVYLAIEEKRINRGDYIYLFNDKPKKLKSVTLYRVILDKFSNELVLTNY